MENGIIISLDQGSSSSKAAAVTVGGRILKELRIPVPFKAQGNIFEYKAEDLLNTQIKVLDDILSSLRASDKILSIALSCQRSTIVLWDKETGSALCPALSWADGRAGAISFANPLSQDVFHAKTGLYNTPFFSAPKIAWCLQNYPAAAQALKEGRLLAGPVGSYIIWHLTGGKKFVCDYACAQRTLLFNIHTLKWDDDILKSFDIPLPILPEVTASSGDFGEYKGIKITVCTGDQQAAALACGLDKQGQGCINYGTGAFFLLNIGAEPKELKGILTSVSAAGANQKPSFLLEGQINAAGSFFTWLKAMDINFDLPLLDEYGKKSKNPLWILPALGGLGAPYWDFNAKPVMAGFKIETKTEDIIYGALRCLCFLMADIIFYIGKAGFEIKGIESGGGLSLNDILPQTQSDILAMPLRQSRMLNTTMIGSAMLAARREGIDTTTWRGAEYKDFSPKFSKEESLALYARWRAFFDWAIKSPDI